MKKSELKHIIKSIIEESYMNDSFKSLYEVIDVLGPNPSNDKIKNLIKNDNELYLNYNLVADILGYYKKDPEEFFDENGDLLEESVIEESVTEYDFTKGFKIKTSTYSLTCEPLQEGYKGNQYTYGIIKLKKDYDKSKNPVTKMSKAIEKVLLQNRIDVRSIHIGVDGYYGGKHHYDRDPKTLYLEIEFDSLDDANKHLNYNFKNKLETILSEEGLTRQIDDYSVVEVELDVLKRVLKSKYKDRYNITDDGTIQIKMIDGQSDKDLRDEIYDEASIAFIVPF